MSKLKSLAGLKAAQDKAKEKLIEKLRRIAAHPVRAKQQQSKNKEASSVSPIGDVASCEKRHWAQVRAGNAQLEYSSRTENEKISAQPWTNEMVSVLLEAADQGGVTLCLVWPAKLGALSLIHALANVERVFAKDLRGLRTLFYPGTHASKAPLQGVLAKKEQLSNFYRSLWAEQSSGSTEVVSNTTSEAFLAALGAINEIRNRHPELPDPSLAELIPVFVFDPAKRVWVTTVANPLERTLSKVDRLDNRRGLRQKIGAEWGVPEQAPGSLMILHNSAKREHWRVALTSSALKDAGRPEAFLFDATSSAMQVNYSAVKRIPDFLMFARENGFMHAGAVVLTDDPKMFFILRKQLYDLKLAPVSRVWAAEADDVLLSGSPVDIGWRPEQRSNSNFNVSIVDRDASQLALTFQRLMASAGSEESSAHKALMAACVYILRLSNMPAGYSDLTAVATEAGAMDFGSQFNAWTPVKLSLLDALASGALNNVRADVDRSIDRAEKLIDDWGDATPMALRMLSEVKKHAIEGRQGISLVLPNNKYVLLAHRFLQRKLGGDWGAVEQRLEWHTLSAVAKTLSGARNGKHFTFMGIGPDVLRILVANPDVPHGTAILIAYRQAESTVKTLAGMKEIDAFKAYRGRIGLLAQEIERRLAEVPNPLAINKLREISLTFKFDEKDSHDYEDGQAYYKFELEGGVRAYASGWVYRYVPDEDPPFRRAAASAIQSGDFIFEMSDELRVEIESSLGLTCEGVSSVVDPVRMLLKLYHSDIQTRCSLMFTSEKRSVLAREIHGKMVEIDPKIKECRPGRVYYWLDLNNEGDTRPHASKDAKFFRAFCQALRISDEDAERNWSLIRSARAINQNRGRELATRYAEILFQPESAAVYRKISEKTIKHLQQEALRCVYRVECVIPPQSRTTTSKKGETSAHSQ